MTRDPDDRRTPRRSWSPTPAGRTRATSPAGSVAPSPSTGCRAAARGRGGRPRPRPAGARDRRSPSPRRRAGCEIAVVFGGDGTILRAAELTRDSGTPLLGVNLGHVGFLAEAEHDDIEFTIDAIVHRRYSSEERLTIDVAVYRDKELVALHLGPQRGQRGEGRPRADDRGGRRGRRPAAVPVGLRRRRLLDAHRVDRLQLQRRRPDRLARRRGPAHGADQRARAVRPADGGRTDVGARRRGASPAPTGPACSGATAGARSTCRPGARIEVRRGRFPVRLARLHQAPFTDRLVAKFDLPVTGWRGAAERRRRNGSDGRRDA